MSFADALIYSLTGMLVVFFALVLLMCTIHIMLLVGDRRAKTSAPTTESVKAAPTPQAAPAPGSAGELKLYDTEPRTAAMLMAIVADELQLPLNELRFLSIREIKEDEQA